MNPDAFSRFFNETGWCLGANDLITRFYVDDVKIGQTPILDGKLVNFGFRKIRLSAGGEYRDWERVVEFKKSEVELIGPRKIVFVKDYMNIIQILVMVFYLLQTKELYILKRRLLHGKQQNLTLPLLVYRVQLQKLIKYEN